jgi:hypothetical protein
MSPAELLATGLQQFDVRNSPGDYDHLPLVVDFRFPSPPRLGDYNSDGAVNGLDYDVWKTAFGTTNSAADGNSNGIVDAGDYNVWRNHLDGGEGAIRAAVPEPAGGVLITGIVAWLACRRRRSKIRNGGST